MTYNNIMSAIFSACTNNQVDKVSELLNKEAERVNIEQVDTSGQSLLCISSQIGNNKLVRLLIEKGATVDPMCNHNNNSCAIPLHIACKNGNTETVRILLDAGANAKRKNKEGMTPLHYACASDADAVEMVHLLLSSSKRGSKKEEDSSINDVVNAMNNKHKWTPLHVACLRGNFEVARLLVAQGANVNAKDLDGCTPLHIASFQGANNNDNNNNSVNIVKLLLDEGAAIDVVDRFHRTPIQHACEEGIVDVTKTLARRGAIISNTVAGAGSSNRIFIPNAELASWLENAKDYTMLQYASDEGDIGEVRRLLCTNNFDETHIQNALAVAADSEEVTCLLRQACEPWKSLSSSSLLTSDGIRICNMCFPESFRMGVDALRAVKQGANSASPTICKFADDDFCELVLSFCPRLWFTQN